MTGILLAILVAILATANSAAVNHAVQHIDKKLVAWASFVFAIPFLFIILCYIGFPEVTSKYWICVGLYLPLISLARYFTTCAHEKSDMSLIMPLLALTPLFILPIAPVVLNQHVTPLGLVGILLIVLGVYLLGIKDLKNGILSPIKYIFKNAGAWYMLGVALIYAISTVIDGKGIIEAGNTFQASMFWVFTAYVGCAVIFTPHAIIALRRNNNAVRNNWKSFVAVGVTYGLTSIFQMWAMTFTLAVYVNSIKRLTIVLSVLVGCLFFKEEGLKERLLAAAITTLGVILIVIS